MIITPCVGSGQPTAGTRYGYAGKCPVCGRVLILTKDKRMFRHGIRYEGK